MIVKRYTLGMYQTNCYLLVDETSGECAVIDPGCVCDDLENEIEFKNYDVKYIILTHGHFDHIGGLEHYMSKYDKATVLMHKYDVDSVLAEYDVFNVAMKNKENVVKKITLQIDGAVFLLGSCDLEIIHTPGHSSGSVCIFADSILFSGDTLFELSIGRTDFVDGNFSEIEQSIRKLYKLPDATIVYPGHGETTTIGKEKISNPFVRL